MLALMNVLEKKYKMCIFECTQVYLFIVHVKFFILFDYFF